MKTSVSASVQPHTLPVSLSGTLLPGTGYFEMRYSNSCYLYDLELVYMLGNAVIEHIQSL